MYFTLITLCFGLLVGLSVCGDVPAKQDREIARKDIRDCKNQSGTTEDETKNMMLYRVPKSRNESCYLACWQKKLGIRNADNKVNINKVRQIILPFLLYNKVLYSQMLRIKLECAKEETTEADECTAARKYAECEVPKIIQLRRPSVTVDTYKDCIKKSNVSAVELINVIVRKIPETKREACMIGCAEREFGILDANYKINMTQVSKRYLLSRQESYDKYMKIYGDCKAIETKEADECVAGQKYAECIYAKESAKPSRLIK